jgi:hypothetical protein
MPKIHLIYLKNPLKNLNILECLIKAKLTVEVILSGEVKNEE